MTGEIWKDKHKNGSCSSFICCARKIVTNGEMRISMAGAYISMSNDFSLQHAYMPILTWCIKIIISG